MIWTDEAVEELKRMWDRGMTTGQIAKALNVTKNSIIGKVHRLCLTARPSPIKKAPETKNEKKAAKIESGSAAPNKTKVASITKAQIREIAELKMKDLNAASIEAAMSMIEGTARSMGVTVIA